MLCTSLLTVSEELKETPGDFVLFDIFTVRESRLKVIGLVCLLVRGEYYHRLIFFEVNVLLLDVELLVMRRCVDGIFYA